MSDTRSCASFLCDLLHILSPCLEVSYLACLRGCITLTAFGLLADIAPRVEDTVMEGRRQPERQSMDAQRKSVRLAK